MSLTSLPHDQVDDGPPQHSSAASDLGSASLSVCAVCVELEHDDPSISRQLHRLWRELFVVDAPAAGTPRVRFSWSVDQEQATSTRRQLLCDSGELRVYTSPAGFVLDCSAASLQIDLKSDRAVGHLGPLFFSLPADAQRRFLLLALVMMIRRHGRFAIHASGVSRSGRGCLIAGQSGSGKTTLGLTLIQHGWKNLSDDVVALLEGESQIEAQAVNRGLSCTGQTLRMFQRILAGPRDAGEKQVMSLINTSSQVTHCRPKLILFPVIGDQQRSELISVNPMQAINQLIQFSAGIMVNPGQASRQLEVLSRLVSQAQVCRLIAGRDVISQPERVAGLIATRIEER